MPSQGGLRSLIEDLGVPERAGGAETPSPGPAGRIFLVSGPGPPQVQSFTGLLLGIRPAKALGAYPAFQQPRVRRETNKDIVSGRDSEGHVSGGTLGQLHCFLAG